MEKDRPDLESMWGCMFAGDTEIKNVFQKSILIVGNSRIGKSTLFNYLSGVNLVGKQSEETGEIFLQPVQKSGVVTKNTLKAVTLIPNLNTIYQNEEQVGLIDTAGFGDQGRSYAGKFGVSYMLEKLFQNIQQVKFIICIAHSLFEVGGVREQVQSLQSFVDLLECETLLREQDAARKFYNSISFVIAKSRFKQNQYITRFQKLAEFISKENNNEKRVLKSILKSVITNKRIGTFQLANDGLQLPRSNILQKLTQKEKNWEFYSFQDNILRQSLIKMPFEKTLGLMDHNQIELYKNDTDKKHEYIRSSFRLLKEFIKKLKENWYEDSVDLSEQFNKVQNLISGHPYGSFQLMLQFLKLEFTIPNQQNKHVTRINMIKKFKQISQKSSNIDYLISNDSQTFNKILKMYKPCFEILDICRKTFCSNRQQQRIFLTFMFITLRSLYQCQMQSKIHKGQSAGVIFIVTGNLNQIFSDSIQNLMSQFLIGFKPKNIEQTQSYEALLQQTIDKHINEITIDGNPKKLIQSLIKIYLKRVDNSLKKQKNFLQALSWIFKISRKFSSYSQLIHQTQDTTQEIPQLCFREIQILKKTGQCLQGLKLYNKAINIYKHIEAVSITMRCYQDWINFTKNKKNKYIAMIGYTKFLQQYGKRTKIIQIYEKMIDQFECFPQKVKKWKEELANILKQDVLNQDTYYNKLTQREKRIIEVNQLILQVQGELQFFVPNQDEQEGDIEQLFESRDQITGDQQQ